MIYDYFIGIETPSVRKKRILKNASTLGSVNGYTEIESIYFCCWLLLLLPLLDLIHRNSATHYTQK